MSSGSSEKSFELRPSWKQFFGAYILSILAIPLFGIGLITLYFIRKKHKKIIYKITDLYIARIDDRYEHKVDLVDITNIETRQSWLQKKLHIADLVLQTSASNMVLGGLQEPGRLKSILEQAIEAEKVRREQQQKTNAREPDYKPGSMDKINYLTGLWQQGLISDEDYKKERKYFE
jgi:hypothetical protein